MLRAWALRLSGHRSPPSSPAFPLLLFASSPPSVVATAAAPLSPAACSSPSRVAMARPVRIAVVGDVHDDWDLEEDSKALHFLQVDLVLFTGDYGNENVELVKSISDLKLPKAAILGNHDSWTTQQFSQKKIDRVRRQLDFLGEEHVGYGHLNFPALNLSVVGGRPFSCGGDRLFRPRLLSVRYGVEDMEGSAKKIREAALGTPEGHHVIILAHNGPTGLGSKLSDICGRDWVFGGGDHGDPDLAQAISDLKRDTQIHIPLVIFGHMHKALAYGNGIRKMIVVGSDNTIYLNGAIVPRVRYLPTSSSIGSLKEESQLQPSENGTSRAFTMIEISDGAVERIAETWILVAGNKVEVELENILYKNP